MFNPKWFGLFNVYSSFVLCVSDNEFILKFSSKTINNCLSFNLNILTININPKFKFGRALTNALILHNELFLPLNIPSYAFSLKNILNAPIGFFCLISLTISNKNLYFWINIRHITIFNCIIH